MINLLRPCITQNHKKSVVQRTAPFFLWIFLLTVGIIFNVLRAENTIASLLACSEHNQTNPCDPFYEPPADIGNKTTPVNDNSSSHSATTTPTTTTTTELPALRQNKKIKKDNPFYRGPSLGGSMSKDYVSTKPKSYSTAIDDITESGDTFNLANIDDPKISKLLTTGTSALSDSLSKPMGYSDAGDNDFGYSDESSHQSDYPKQKPDFGPTSGSRLGLMFNVNSASYNGPRRREFKLALAGNSANEDAKTTLRRLPDSNKTPEKGEYCRVGCYCQCPNSNGTPTIDF